MLKAVWLSSAVFLSMLTYDLVLSLTYDSPAQNHMTVEPKSRTRSECGFLSHGASMTCFGLSKSASNRSSTLLV